MFSTWCLRNFLFGLLIIALILSVLQVILIFMNNMIFGAVLMVSYIIFFQVFIFALCRDSITLFFTTIVFLFIFLIGCICIQSTNTEIQNIFAYDKEDSDSGSDEGTTDAPVKRSARFYSSDINVDCCYFAFADSVAGRYAAIPLVVLQACCHNYSRLGDPISNYCHDAKLGKYFSTKGCSQFQKEDDDGQTEEVDSQTEEVTSSVEEIDNRKSVDKRDDPASESEGKDKTKKAKFLSELRWISNVLGVMHILMIALIFCYLYELLFGYCDHPYTYC
ncbi:hypothetical protein HHI36_016386 [Cryptolaemus montrouzieri]|uniref:Uncharacterized protein n=1 Tax=Cryptolaemus montrouzieri TaxID=559131 RepID=A0ABD2NJB6_9CUCU